MTYETIVTMHETLKSEYNRIHKQLNAADSACRAAWHSIDEYRNNNPDAYEQLSELIEHGGPVRDEILTKGYNRWRELGKIVKRLSVKDKQLEKALCEFELHNW